MAGQMVLVVGEEQVAAVAVWETLPAERQREVTLRLARLVARMLEGERRVQG